MGYIVQSKRVKNHLIFHSSRINSIYKKYIISHGCIIPMYNNLTLLSWNERKYDVLIYAKFADEDREKELINLYNTLSKYFSIKLVRYGNHTKYSLQIDSNNSKILIYFSYYDCWPSSLMEIQNYGAYPIVEDCELIDRYGICLNNLYKNTKIIMQMIKEIKYKQYDSHKISDHYRKRNNCLNIFQNTLFEIYYRKTNNRIHYSSNTN